MYDGIPYHVKQGAGDVTKNDNSPPKWAWLWSRDCFKILPFTGDAARRAGLSTTAELLV